jgi:hypothetical protein
MRSRLHDIPILKSTRYRMEAVYYNRVYIALKRIGNPLRIELINLRGLDIVIDNDEWICVDRAIGDFPTMAWTGFERNKRNALYEPVPCELRLYHSHAELICGTVLDLVYRCLSKQLIKSIKPSVNNVIVFTK